MTTLRERLTADIQDASARNDEFVVSVLRWLRKSINYSEPEPGAYNDEDVRQVAEGVIATFRGRSEELRAAGRAEDAEYELKKVEILQRFLQGVRTL